MQAELGSGRRLLHSQWAALVTDHMVLATQPAAVQAALHPRLFPRAPQPAVAANFKYMAAAWPHVLSALCASLSAAAHAASRPVAAGADAEAGGALRESEGDGTGTGH